MKALIAGALLLVMITAGCTRGPKLPPPEITGGDPDSLSAPAPLPLPSAALDYKPVRILLTDPVDGTHAPVPRNESERLVFRQLYETLVEVDGNGQVLPRLAVSWRSDDGGRVWTFRLRMDARFSDGSAVDPAAIAASWDKADWQPGSAGLLLPWGFVSPDSVTGDADGDLQVALAVPVGDRPQLFAHPALAVVKSTGAGTWPLGSGTHVLTGPVSRARFTALPVDSLKGAPLRFRVAAGEDPRNLVPRDADLVLVSERSLLEYASLLPDFQTTPLRIARTYCLVTPDPGADEAGQFSPYLGQQMAADALSTIARAVPFSSGDDCPGLTRPKAPPVSGAPAGGGRIAFLKEDREARRVAERLVALTRAAGRQELPEDLADNARLLNRLGGGKGETVVPEGISDARLGSMLSDGRLALVIGVPAGFPETCLERAALLNRIGLARDSEFSDLRRFRNRVYRMFTITPVLVHRSGIHGWRPSWDGVPVLDGIGWVRQDP